jgi:opacity protein-like surface antigen
MRLRLICCAAVAGLGLAPAAHAQSPWYVSGSLGGYFREDESGPETITNHVVTGPGTATDTFDPGFMANLAVGYRLPLNFRIEVEAGYANYTTATTNPQSALFPTLRGQQFTRRTGGGHTISMGTLNLFYDLPIPGRFVPYIGGGLGGAHTDSQHTKFLDASGDGFTEAGGESTRGVALVEGGLNIAVAPKLTLVPAYRYLHFFGIPSSRGDEVAHIVKLGLRYSF